MSETEQVTDECREGADLEFKYGIGCTHHVGVTLEKALMKMMSLKAQLSAAESRATAAEAECERLREACRAVLGYAWGKSRSADPAFAEVVDKCHAVFLPPPEAPKPEPPLDSMAYTDNVG